MKRIGEIKAKMVLGYVAAGATYGSIAKWMGLSCGTVRRIGNRVAYSNIPAQPALPLPEGMNIRRVLPSGAEGRFAYFTPDRPKDDCWLWRGGVGGNGYGAFVTAECRFNPAHRFSYELANGPIPKGMHVLHRCDVPLCVNPAHLFLGTHADNMRDLKEKGLTKKSGCRRGHPWTAESTFINPNGSRGCRICRSNRQREKYQARRAALNQVGI